MNLNTNSDILLEKLDHIVNESKNNHSNSESMLTRLRESEVKLREFLHNTNELIAKINLTSDNNMSMSIAN